MIQLALRSALSDRAAEGRVAVVEAWGFDVPRTREARAALEALDVGGKVLVVLEADDETAAKSFRNLPEVQLLRASELNAYDVLCNDWVLFTRATLPGGSDDAGGPAVSAPIPVLAPAEAAARPATASARAGGPDEHDWEAPLRGADES
jgi:large subunit ribosomal protein L4